MINYELLKSEIANQPYPMLFATISGAHLYGFPSPDSDFDMRGVHILPLKHVIGLNRADETVQMTKFEQNLELDLVTHDVKKFMALMLKPNGYVLEQLLSPLVLHTTPEHDELKNIAQDCITRQHSQHYLGFAVSQYKFFQKEKRIKLLLYTFRVLLTGIWLMQTGQIEANLATLNQEFKLSYVDELIARKLSQAEKSGIGNADLPFYDAEYNRLFRELNQAYERSSLPAIPSGKDRLNDLLIRLRLK